MDDEAFNLSVRRFLKQFGITAQREIERAVGEGLREGRLQGSETLSARAVVVVEGVVEAAVHGEITLS